MGKRYHLRAHAVTVNEGVANAFIAPDGSHIYPVALVEGSSATLELRGVPANVTGFEASFPGAAAGTWAKVKSATAAIPACQANASAFVHLFATQPNVHCAIRSLIYFKLWNEMCKIVLAAAEDSGPFIERYAERAGDWKQVGERLPSRLLAIAIADEASLSSQTRS